jgi:hypothetical protein
MTCKNLTPDTPLSEIYALPARVYIDFIAKRDNGGYKDYDIATIVSHYIEVGQGAQIDPLFLISQMCHECGYLSSWWSQRPRRNPAGIGVTGRTSTKIDRPGQDWIWNAERRLWVQGYTFNTWRDSALAHYGHLLGYMLTDVQLDTDSRKSITACDPRLSAIPKSSRGVAKCLRDLNGRWAVPGTTYATRICAIATAILETA